MGNKKMGEKDEQQEKGNKAREGRVPLVLTRAYGERARSLREAIVSILPPPKTTDECRCKGKGCLGCADDPSSFLLREGDDAEYLKLLTRGFAVLPKGASSVAEFFPGNRRTQIQLVRNTIDLMILGMTRKASSNVMCIDYDKAGLINELHNVLILELPVLIFNQQTRCSQIVDILSSSPWTTLLSRIGDIMMVHLLRFTSIYLLISRNEYFQVTGTPMYEFLQLSKFLRNDASVAQLSLQSASVSGPPFQTSEETNCRKNETCQHMSSVQSSQRKQLAHSFCGKHFQVTGKFESSCTEKKHKRPFSWQRRRRQRLKNGASDVHNQIKVPSSDKYHGVPVDSDTNESCNALVCGKRKFGQAYFLENHNAEAIQVLMLKKISRSPLSNSHILNRTGFAYNVAVVDRDSLEGACCLGNTLESPPSYRSLKNRTFHTKVDMGCFLYSMHCYPQKVKGNTLVKRRHIFYNATIHRTLLPIEHILLKLKPNDQCAAFLIHHVFSMSWFDKPTFSPLFCEDTDCLFQLRNLTCTVLNIFKTLIRSAQHCQFLKLLERHCPIHSVTYSATESHKDVFEMKLGQRPGASAVTYHFDNLDMLANRIRRGSGRGISSMHSMFQMTNGMPAEETLEKASSEAARYWHMYETNNFCKHKEVVSFVWAVCRNVVPISLLGDPCNWRSLRQNIALFVRLRKFEKICLKHCMHKLKTSYFSFPAELICVPHMKRCKTKKLDCGDLLAAQKFLGKKLVEIWVLWLFSYVIGPLLKAHFYITESENGRHDIFYYRKVIWKKKVKKYMDTLENQKFRLLDPVSCAGFLNEKSYLYPKVRFVPKEDGLRPLVNYRLEAADICGLHVILKGIKMKHPQLFGSSVYDYDDVYRKFHPFLASLKMDSLSIPRTFFITCDVSKAFDSVDHKKLLRMMYDVLHEEEYHLKKFIQICCSKRSLMVQHDHLLVDPNKPGHTVFASKCKSSLHSVLIDQDSVKKIKREELLFLLEKHIRRNIWKLGRNFYLCETGISQGSMISPLLCCFYYGHLERNIIFPSLENHPSPPAWECQSRMEIVGLTQTVDLDHRNTARINELSEDPMNQPSSFEEQTEELLMGHARDCQINSVAPPKFLLLRLVDDFIFMSSSMEQATNFFLKMSKGFEDYNCRMNHQKFRTNFDSPLSHTKFSKGTYTDDDGATFIPWCGLLIDCHTLEVQADYTRYLGIHLRSTLTVWRASKPGQHMKASLRYYMRPKCHPLFYDSNINSGAVVRLNAYQAFLLCAMKFHCYVCSMHGLNFNPTYYMEMIENSISYMYMLINKRVDCFRSESSLHPILQLEKGEVQCLGLSAYICALKRKQSRHKELLLRLKSKAERYQVLFASADMRYAVEDSHSSVFWKIKY